LMTYIHPHHSSTLDSLQVLHVRVYVTRKSLKNRRSKLIWRKNQSRDSSLSDSLYIKYNWFVIYEGPLYYSRETWWGYFTYPWNVIDDFLNDIDKGSCLFAMQISSNMTKISVLWIPWEWLHIKIKK
jgi:hypothetical protein